MNGFLALTSCPPDIQARVWGSGARGAEQFKRMGSPTRYSEDTPRTSGCSTDVSEGEYRAMKHPAGTSSVQGSDIYCPSAWLKCLGNKQIL